MAIIKCDDVVEEQEVIDEESSGTTSEPYVEQDEVSLGKKLLAVENDSFSPSTPFVDVLPEVRNSDISDTFRADAGLYWYLSGDGKMVHPTLGYIIMSESEDEASLTGTIGMSKTESKIDIIGNSNYFTSTEQWDAVVDGTDDSRPSPLIPAGHTFEDHAFEMNTPFSKKELEMFANIKGSVSAADVESDYDFYSKAYEEGIKSTTVPENALPHLYTEVQRGESGEMNTDKLPAGYFRDWIDNILSNQDKMNEIAEDYENVAILDSVVSEESAMDSENPTTSAFEILMAYARRENLFPMNVNIEMDTIDSSKVMLEAEDVGMTDDIVRLLMGEGNVEPVAEFVEEPKVVLTEEVLQGSYDKVADSMAKLNQSKAITAYIPDTVMAEIDSFIADVKNGTWSEEMAADIQSKVNGVQSNASISGYDMELVNQVTQELTDLMDSNSLMNSVVSTNYNMVNKNVF
jgi:hypothetical protein